MKTLLITILIASACTVRINAQICPPNGTHTDPVNATPVNSGFRTNDFDWKRPQLDMYKLNINQGYNTTAGNTTIGNPSPVVNPFHSNADHLAAIASDVDPSKRDYNPQDGWELIKQDLGFYYDAAHSPGWEGIPKVQGLVRNGVTTDNYTSPPYIILYNKYSAKLRVIGMYKQTSGFQHINITLSFDNTLANAYSGLFNTYNSPSVQPLDQKTKVTHIAALASFQDQLWFYADFPMMYDPCTCHYPSALQVSFDGIQESEIKETGVGIGVGTDISNITGSSDAMYGDLYSDKFLTSFYDDNGQDKTIDKLVANVKSATDLANVASQAKEADAEDAVSKGFTLISNILQVGGDDSGATGIIGKTLGAIANIIDFFGAAGGKAPEKTQPIVISSNFVARGYVKLTDHIGDTKIGNPGSLGSNNLPEYKNSVQPSYPMYNEAMGLFAMMHSPTAQIGSTISSSNYTQYISGSNIEWTLHNVTTSHNSALLDPISYTMNPIVNTKATRIMAAYEYSITHTVNGVVIDTVTTLTPFMPIQCLSSFTNCYDLATDFFHIASGPDKGAADANGLLYTDNGKYTYSFTHPGPIQLSQENVIALRLVLSIVYVFNPDEYKIVHTGYQLLKYDITQKPAGNSFSDHFCIQGFPYDVTLDTQPIPGGSIIFAFNDITITGHLNNYSNIPVYIRAGNQIIIEPGATIDPNIILEINQSPCTADQTPPAELSSTYCTGNNYLANQSAKSAPSIPAVANASDLAPDFLLYPNPTHDFANIIFSAAQSQAYSIHVKDMSGRIVSEIGGTAITGLQKVVLDIKSLPAGTYLVSFNCGTAAHNSILTVIR